MKEKIKKVTFNVTPQICVRVIETTDSEEIKKEKNKFPFKLHNDVIVTVFTNKRKFSFKIPEKYIWNGADIPRIMWRVVGSKTDNAFLTASMVHDFILQYKAYVYEQVLQCSISIKEYRRLTSLTFRQIIKDTGTNTVKANIMAWCVDVFQMTVNKGAWECR